MRIDLPAHQCFEQMPSVVREEVDAREVTSEPGHQQVDSQRETVHFGKQCHQERREHAKGAPIAARLGPGEAEGEQDKH
ncbi:hypothetical protein D3C76_1000160 [compost metagenome]